MKVSKKYIDFLKNYADVEFLEGTTASGKTTVGGVKFILKVGDSDKPLHVLASKTTGTAEKNIINADFGLLQIFPNLKYNGNGDKNNKIPHLVLNTKDKGDKIIYVLGYDNIDKWKLALGSQFGCVMIDEINTANIDFVREICTRNDYMIGTLNPDDPNIDVYKEFINCSRPLEKYKSDVPIEILEDLKEEPKPKWDYWFFSFYDNISITEEQIQKKITSAPKGTKLYKNKILGLRGKATGVIFCNFDRKKHIITKEQAKIYKFEYFSAGVDTSYSQKSPDTIAFSFIGITQCGKCIVLDERVYNNSGLDIPIAPSDTVKNLIDFLDRNRKEWGLSRNVFLDSADQATMTEFKKYKRLFGSIYTLNNAWKKTEIIDRINLQLGWFAQEDYLIVDTCKTYIHELEVYSWLEDKDNKPEDKNDHMVNSTQYAWIPYKKQIGIGDNR